MKRSLFLVRTGYCRATLMFLSIFVLPVVGHGAEASPTSIAGDKAYKAKDYVGASALFDQACKDGDMQGCHNAALLYGRGDGVAQDKARARMLLVQSCEGGYAKGCLFAANVFYTGGGGPRDPARARELFALACKGGAMEGCYNAAHMFDSGAGGTRDQGRARELFDRACIAGDAAGCYNLAAMFSTGAGGARDMARARKFYEKACKGGIAQGCAKLKIAVAKTQDVWKVQTCLKMRGFNPGIADGVMGQKTRAAIAAYEKTGAGIETVCGGLNVPARQKKKTSAVGGNEQACVKTLPKKGEPEKLPKNSQARVDFTMAMMNWTTAWRAKDWNRCMTAGKAMQAIIKRHAR